MNLTPEDFERINTKKLATAIRKVKEERSLTARDEAILARAEAQARGIQASGNSATVGFVTNWVELADQLDTSRRSLQTWRSDARFQPTPADKTDGRKEVAAWQRWMILHGLKRADEAADPDDVPEERRSVRDWKNYREELLCAQLERAIAKGDELLLVATELEVGFGQLLSGFNAAMNHLPGSAARFVVGQRDVHVVQQKLQGEVDAVLQRLYAARYLDECLPEICTEVGIDLAMARALLGAIGRRAIADVKGTTAKKDPPDPATGQVTAAATEKHAAARTETLAKKQPARAKKQPKRRRKA